MLYIIFSIAVSKLYSLHYPADDANVLQTSLSSILVRKDELENVVSSHSKYFKKFSVDLFNSYLF